MKDEAPRGFTVGGVLERGRCECCSTHLNEGDRAALWSPTGELYCIPCANRCHLGDGKSAWPLILLAGVFVAAVVAYLLGL
jgi:hypothetical protein